MNLGDPWSGWRVGGACTLGLSQRGEIGMDRSACGSSRSPLPSGRPDSDVWDSTPLQAEVTKLPPPSLLNSGPDDRKNSVQVVKGHMGWRGSFSTRTYWAFIYKCQPQSQHSHHHQERYLRLPLSLFRVNMKTEGSASLPEKGTRGLGQLHPLGLAQLLNVGLF